MTSKMRTMNRIISKSQFIMRSALSLADSPLVWLGFGSVWRVDCQGAVSSNWWYASFSLRMFFLSAFFYREPETMTFTIFVLFCTSSNHKTARNSLNECFHIDARLFVQWQPFFFILFSCWHEGKFLQEKILSLGWYLGWLYIFT